MSFKKILAIVMVLTILFITLGMPIVATVATVETSAMPIVEIKENSVEEDIAEVVDEEIIESKPEEDITALPATTIYTTTKLRLRAGPSTETEIIDTLKINTQLDKIGEEGDWTIVRVDGQKYYVYSKYTSTEKTIIKTVSRASNTDRIAETSVNEASEQESRQFFRLLYFNLLLLL